MGERTVIKYFTIFMVFSRVAIGFFNKWQEAKKAGSAGGEKITAEEWAEVGVGIATDIMSALPELEVVVFMKPKEQV